jgi:hypothetical protein
MGASVKWNDLTDDEREFCTERAAIREYCGGQTRAEANVAALGELSVKRSERLVKEEQDRTEWKARFGNGGVMTPEPEQKPAPEKPKAVAPVAVVETTKDQQQLELC